MTSRADEEAPAECSTITNAAAAGARVETGCCCGSGDAGASRESSRGGESDSVSPKIETASRLLPTPADSALRRRSKVDWAKTYFLGTNFSIYDEMSNQLKRIGWRGVSRPDSMTRCALILGDRFSIPYHNLRTLSRSDAVKPWVNYFQGSHKLTLKAPMAKVLAADEVSSGGGEAQQPPPWLPVTYVVCTDAARKGVVDERERLKLAMNSDADDVRRRGSLWIVKPSSGCKGDGVAIASTFDDAMDVMQRTKSIFVVQRYVDRPLLVRGRRKFDIRIWALLVHPYSIYLYREGSCRTASAPYDATQLDNRVAHLTNHCIQESSASYGEYEKDNEIMLSELEDHVLLETEAAQSRRAASPTLLAVLRPQVEHIVVRSLVAVQDLLMVGDGEPFRCFQLFGYDFLVDDELNVHLLEINGSPGAAQRLLAYIVEGILDIVVRRQEERQQICAPPDGWDLIFSAGEIRSTTDPVGKETLA